MGRPLNAAGRDTREAILDAALDVFAENGFHGASMKDIAAVVGVRNSAIYHYFESKEDLLDAILAERAKPRPDEERTRSLEEPITDARAVLERIGDVAVKFIETPRAQKVYRVLMSDGLRLHAEKRIDLLRHFDGRHLTTLMARMITAKLLRPRQPEVLAMEFVAPLYVLMLLRIVDPDHPLTKYSGAFVRAHVDQFLKGASSDHE